MRSRAISLGAARRSRTRGSDPHVLERDASRRASSGPARRTTGAHRGDPGIPTTARIALTTAPDADTARRIARTLVEERLAACVNVVPGVASVYRWEGAIHEDAELLLIVKTSADRIAALAERLAVIHPYALPELVALTPSGGSARYLEWLHDETRLE